MANYFEQFETPQQQPAVDVSVRPYGTATPAAPPPNYFAQFEEAPSVPLDVAKSAGVGVGQGLIGAAGSIGDIRSALSSGVDYLGGKLGISPETVQAGKQVLTNAFPGGQAIAAAPTSEQLQNAVESQTGPFYQPQTTPGQYAQTIGQFAPAVIGGPGGIVRRAITQAVVPAIASETAGQIYKGTPLEPYARAVAGIGGAVAGPGAIASARKLATPFPISAERQAAVQTLANEGVQIPAGMATGSKTLKAAESELGGGAVDLNQRAQEQYTQAVLRKAGIDAPAATPDVLNAAADRIGNMFDTVAARNPSIPIPGFDKVAQAVQLDYQRLTNQPSKYLEELRGRITPTISGDQYQAIQSEIRRMAQASSSPELKNALFDMKRALDAAVQGGLKNPADVAQWKEARRLYGNFKTIESAVGGPSEGAAYGHVTPAKLTQAINSQSKLSYARGRGDFAELARAGNAVMKPYQDSGTATRGFVKAIPAMVMGAIGAGIHPLGVAAAAVGPTVGGKVLMSPLVQRYLANQRFAAPAARSGGVPALLPYGVAANQGRRPEQQ